jgi:carbonic anhydrase
MADESAGVGADDALGRLLNGDKRFVGGKSEEPHGAALIERRHALAKDQKPVAVIVSCSPNPLALKSSASLNCMTMTR